MTVDTHKLTHKGAAADVMKPARQLRAAEIWVCLLALWNATAVKQSENSALFL